MGALDAETEIRALGGSDIVLFDEHFTRHHAESGRGDRHFMPFAPDECIDDVVMTLPVSRRA